MQVPFSRSEHLPSTEWPLSRIRMFIITLTLTSTSLQKWQVTNWTNKLLELKKKIHFRTQWNEPSISLHHWAMPCSSCWWCKLAIGWCYWLMRLFYEKACDYTLITNLMHWLLFIRKILLSPTCFEHQVLIFRRTQLYTSSIWYRHSL